jgi:hypothetical protein
MGSRSSPIRTDRTQALIALGVFMLLAGILLWRPLLKGEAFVPAKLLTYAAPWSSTVPAEQRPIWNPLMYDSVGQFYTWRSYLGSSFWGLEVPLWNPNQFCGTPFLANSQSAVFYPPNVFNMFPGPARTAGWNVGLHLVWAALGMYLLLKRLGASHGAGLVAGVTFAFSTWEVSWLHLSTFLCTSAWLPWLASAGLAAIVRPGARQIAGIGLCAGMCLLAGHLQIAFYSIMGASVLVIWKAVETWRGNGSKSALAGLGACVLGLLLGLMIAAPQVLPSVELAKRSHRAATPSSQGYEAYTDYSVPAGSLATLLLPDFFGNPSATDPALRYFGVSRKGSLFNYAEGAMYVGILPLLLTSFALLRRRQEGKLLGAFGVVALLSLMMALGTSVDALLYFYMPGFGSSGSPGRSLVLWAFAIAALAGLGWEKLQNDDAAPVKSAVVSIASVAALLLVGYLLGLRMLDPDMGTWAPDAARQLGILVIGAGLVAWMAKGRLRQSKLAWIPLAIVCVDLLAANINYNPTAKQEDIYPGSDLVAITRELAGHDRIAPINRGWSFAGPTAVLPPNGGTQLGFKDVQGYDSLFPGRYKAYLDKVNGQDSAPPEVGNMLFLKQADPAALAEMGVRIALALKPEQLPWAQPEFRDGVYYAEVPNAPGRARMENGTGTVQWVRDDPDRVELNVDTATGGDFVLADTMYAGWRAWVDGKPAEIGLYKDVFRQLPLAQGQHTVEFRFEPASYRIGLFLALVSLGVCAALLSIRNAGRQENGVTA